MLPEGLAFPADDFRAGIHLAMEIGLPPEEEMRPTFYFRERYDVGTEPADDEQVPFDPAARPVAQVKDPVRLPCAVEYLDAAGKVVEFGVVQPTRVLLTFLDVDYAKVRDSDGGAFSYVVISGDRYYYSKTPPEMGLASVGITQVYCTAEDDT